MFFYSFDADQQLRSAQVSSRQPNVGQKGRVAFVIKSQPEDPPPPPLLPYPARPGRHLVSQPLPRVPTLPPASQPLLLVAEVGEREAALDRLAPVGVALLAVLARHGCLCVFVVVSDVCVCLKRCVWVVLLLR